MGFFKKIALYCSLFNMALAPSLAHAQSTQPPLTVEEQKTLKSYENFYSADKGYRFVFENEGNTRKAVIYDNFNQALLDIPLSTPEKLKQFSPKNLNAALKAEWSKAKKSNSVAFSHAVKNLPTESAIFFMAMGAVVAGQLVTDYASNPLGMQQHLQHQLSPVGTLGFFTFMYTQGVTSNVLSSYMGNHKFGKYLIPYLGMTVGAFAQSNLSLILTDPNVKACAKVMIGKKVSEADLARGVDEDPCEAAYQHMVVDQVPLITSMLMSSFIAAGVQKTAIVGGKMLTKAGANLLVKQGSKRLAIIGISVTLRYFPGVIQIEGIKAVLGKFLNIGMFVEFDHWLNSKVTYAWKNQTTGAEFINHNNSLVEHIFHQKRNNWNADPTTFIEELKQFSKKSSDWRMINMGDVYTAHQNWIEMLQQLLSMYNASHKFYTTFTEQIIAGRSGDPQAALNKAYPLLGVNAKGLNEGSEEMYYSDPESLIGRQMATVLDVSKYLQSNLANGTYKKMGFNTNTIAALTRAQVLTASNDLTKMGQGILSIKTMLSTDPMYSGASYSAVLIKDKPIYKEYQKLITMLGNPNPIAEQGRGFGMLYEKYSENAQSLTGIKYPRYQKDKGNLGIGVTNATEYFVYQMLYGPNPSKDKLIDSAYGFSSTFLPPKITNEYKTPDMLPDNRFNENTIFGQKVSIYDGWVSSTFAFNAKETYPNAVEYIKKNMRQSIISVAKNTNMMDKWWQVMTESQMIEAFDDFSDKYQDIVVKLVKTIFKTEKSSWNAGPMANGPLNSAFQEARVYQMVLGELLKDSYRNEYKAELPEKYFYTHQKEPVGPYLSNVVAPSYISLLSATREAGTMEFDRLVEKFVTNPNMMSEYKVTRTPRGYSLVAQARIESEMYVLTQLLKRIQVKEVTKASGSGTHEVIQSDLENYQLDEQKDKIDTAIATFGNLLGLGETKEQALVQLSEPQQKLAKAALEKISAITSEMLMYGRIANAVSWDKIQGLKASEKENQDFRNEAQQRQKDIRKNLFDRN